MVKYLILSCIVFTSTIVSGQKGWEVGGWLGSSFYYGDLNNEINLKSPGLAGGLLTKWNYNSRLSARGSINYGRISANDANSNNNFDVNRNLNFYSDVFDLTGGFEFNFFEHVRGSKFETYTPYVFLGASIFHFNPKTELDGVTYSLQEWGTEGQDIGEEYLRISTGITLGGGFKYDIASDITLSVEYTTRRVFTDFIDDVSTTFPDFNTLEAVRGPIAVQLSDRALIDGIGIEGRQRGNSTDNDYYSFISFSITKFFGRLECPPISKIR